MREDTSSPKITEKNWAKKYESSESRKNATCKRKMEEFVKAVKYESVEKYEKQERKVKFRPNQERNG